MSMYMLNIVYLLHVGFFSMSMSCNCFWKVPSPLARGSKYHRNVAVNLFIKQWGTSFLKTEFAIYVKRINYLHRKDKLRHQHLQSAGISIPAGVRSKKHFEIALCVWGAGHKKGQRPVNVAKAIGSLSSDPPWPSIVRAGSSLSLTLHFSQSWH